MKIRLLPSLILVASLTLMVKLGGLYYSVGAAFAQNSPPPAAGASSKPGAAAPQAAAPAAPAADPAAGGRTPPPRLLASSGSGKEGTKDAASFTPAEVEILQALSERRAEIDRRSEEVNQREILLKATEQRINERIAKLEDIQKTIDGLLKKYDEQEENKIKSLVKIYETMKPKEAARIFEQMEMPVLLSVVERMKDRAVAPVLASMDPEKAKQVTVAMAEKRQLPALN